MSTSKISCVSCLVWLFVLGWFFSKCNKSRSFHRGCTSWPHPRPQILVFAAYDVLILRFNSAPLYFPLRCSFWCQLVAVSAVVSERQKFGKTCLDKLRQLYRRIKTRQAAAGLSFPAKFMGRQVWDIFEIPYMYITQDRPSTKYLVAGLSQVFFTATLPTPIVGMFQV